MYIYESHLGGLFTVGKELSIEEAYCEQCGDSDCLIGEADTREEAEELLKEKWDARYLEMFLNDYFS